jgi:hypothetical protein
MRVCFVRKRGERDRVYVTRTDGTEVSWVFPSYGDALPHDLVHLVVEAAFGLARGFWGRVDEGADVARMNAAANRAGGKDKYAGFGADLGELLLAEALANGLAARLALGEDAPDLPAPCSAERAREAKSVLDRLTQRWRAIDPKGAIELHFDRADLEGTFARL